MKSFSIRSARPQHRRPVTLRLENLESRENPASLFNKLKEVAGSAAEGAQAMWNEAEKLIPTSPEDAFNKIKGGIQYLANAASESLFNLALQGQMESYAPYTFEPTVLNYVPSASDPVYYVNGAATRLAGASREAKNLADTLLRPVKLIHNPTDISNPYFGELTYDTPSAEHTVPVGFIGDMVQATSDRFYFFPRAQNNETTRQVTRLMYDHWKAGKDLSIVCHSQGTLIVNASMRTLQALGAFGGLADWVSNHLKVVMTGVPMTREEIAKSHNLTALANPGDAAAEFSGLLIGGRKGISFTDYTVGKHDFVKSYVSQVNNSMLFGAGGTVVAPVPTLPADAQEEADGDNTPDTAFNLGGFNPRFGEHINLSGTMGTGPDVDWFKFTVTEGLLGPGDLVEISYDHAETDLTLWLYANKADAKGNRPIRYDLAAGKDRKQLSFNGLGPGTYYVNVDSRTNTIGSYSAEFEISPGLPNKDAEEPNNGPDDAPLLATGAWAGHPVNRTVSRNLHQTGDVDWWAIDLKEKAPNGSYLILNFSHAAGDLLLQLYRDDGNGGVTLVDKSDTLTDAESLTMAGYAAGRYYVRVAGYNGDVVNYYTLQAVLPEAASVPPAFVFPAARGSHTLFEGQFIRLDFKARDGNGQAIDYSLVNAPAGMSINPISGQVAYEPVNGAAGSTYKVKVRATDSSGLSADSTIEFRIISGKPSIREVTASVNTITDAGSDKVTLTANGVTTPFGIIERVEFWLDVNGNGVLNEAADRQLAYDFNTFGSNSPNKVDGYTADVYVSGLAPGSYNLLTRARRPSTQGTFYSPVTVTPLTITAAPVIPTLTTKVGGELQANAGTASLSEITHTTFDSAGNTYVFGTSDRFTSPITATMRKFDPAGALLATVTLAGVNGAINDVDMSGIGRFAVAWRGAAGLMARVFSSDGTPFDAAQTITTASYRDRSGRVAMINGSGGYAVVWAEGNYISEQIKYRRFVGSTLKPVLTLNGGATGTYPDIARFPTSNSATVVGWADYGTTRIEGVQVFDNDTVGTEFVVSAPGVEMGWDDRLKMAQYLTETVFIWQGLHTAGTGSDIYARRFTGTTPASTPFRVNSTAADEQFSPRLEARAGRYVVGWGSDNQELGQPAGQSGFYAQAYTLGDTPLGGNFLVNTTEAGNQYPVGVALDPSGNNFHAVWSGNGPNGTAYYRQRFTGLLNVPPPGLALKNVGAVFTTVPESGGVTPGAIGLVDSSDPHITLTGWQLVPGAGAADNAKFKATGEITKFLTPLAPFDYEKQKSYSIRVRGTAPGGYTLEQILTLDVTNDPNERLEVNLSPAGGVLFTEGDAPKPVSAALTVGGATGGFVKSAKVRVATGFASGQDKLAFTPTAGITGTFSAATGILTLTGDAAPAAYQAVLRSVTFENTSVAPKAGPRSVSVQVFDSKGAGAIVSRPVDVALVNTVPVLTATTTPALTWVENTAAVKVAPDLAITDIDNPTLAGATVAILGGFNPERDQLRAAAAAGVKKVYNPLTGVLTFTGKATRAAYTALLRSVTFSSADEGPSESSRVVAFTVFDGIDTSPAVTRTVEVTPVNDAPVLDTRPTPKLAPVAPTDTNPAGTAVSDLLGTAGTDPDGTLVPRGIAVTAAGPLAAGEWQYSNNGSDWYTMGLVSGQARLLRDSDYVRFVPNSGVIGTATLSYRAWDQTGGALFSLHKIVATGRTTPFSTGVETATVLTNLAPVLNTALEPAFPPMKEDGGYSAALNVSVLAGAGISDSPKALKGIAVTGVTHGVWQYSVTGGRTWIDITTASDADAVLLRDADKLRLRPGANERGTATISYRAWDRTSGAAGQREDVSARVGGAGAFSTATETATILVTPVNDAPVYVGGSLPLVLRNDPVNGTALSSQLLYDGVNNRVYDADGWIARWEPVPTPILESSAAGIAVTDLTGTANGVWEYYRSGTWLPLDLLPGKAKLLHIDQSVRFVPNAGFTGTVAMSFRLWDGLTGVSETQQAITAVGGATAFSAQKLTATLTV